MSNILNRKAVKDHILSCCEKYRPGWDCKRVSKQALDEIEAFVRMKVKESVHRHPSKGKTFMHFD